MQDLQHQFQQLALQELLGLDLKGCEERHISQLARQCVLGLGGGRGKEGLARCLVGISVCFQALNESARDGLYLECVAAFQELFGRLNMQLQQAFQHAGLVPADLLLMTELSLRSFLDVQLLQLPRSIRQSPRCASVFCNFLNLSVTAGEFPAAFLSFVGDNSQLLRVIFSKTQAQMIADTITAAATYALRVGLETEALDAIQAAASLTPIDNGSQLNLTLASDETQRETQRFLIAEILKGASTTRISMSALLPFLDAIVQQSADKFTPGCYALFSAVRYLPGPVQNEIRARLAQSVLKNINGCGILVVAASGFTADNFIASNEKDRFYAVSLVLKAIYQQLWPSDCISPSPALRLELLKALNSIFDDFLLHAAYQPYLQRVGAPLISDIARRMLQQLFVVCQTSVREVPGTLQGKVSVFCPGGMLDKFLKREEVSAQVQCVQQQIVFLGRLQECRFARGYSGFNWIFQAALTEIQRSPGIMAALAEEHFSVKRYVTAQTVQTQRLTLPSAGKYQITMEQLEAELQGGPVTLERIYREKPQLLMFLPFLAEVGLEAYAEVLEQIAQKETHIRTQVLGESSLQETSTAVTTTKDEGLTTAEFSVISEAIDHGLQPSSQKETCLMADFLREKASKNPAPAPEPCESSCAIKEDVHTEDEFKLVFK